MESISSNIKKSLHVVQVRCKSVVRQAIKENLTVLLLRYAVIQQGQHTAIGTGADEPAKSLLQRQSRLGYLIIAERISPLLAHHANASLHYRIIRCGERQLVYDNAA